MLDIGNEPLGGLREVAERIAKSLPAGAPIGWMCPRCQTVNSPATMMCFSCSHHISPVATCV